MELRSTFQVFEEAAGQDRSKESIQLGDWAVAEYLQTTDVIVENVGTQPFEGPPAKALGKQYRIAPGEKQRVPLAAVFVWLGNWALRGPIRLLVHENLKGRYGYFDELYQEDIVRYSERVRLLETVMSSKAVPKENKDVVKGLSKSLPFPREIPKLRVLDPDSLEEFPVKWPLYDPDWEPDFAETDGDLRTVVDQLKDEVQRLRREAAAEYVAAYEAAEEGG